MYFAFRVCHHCSQLDHSPEADKLTSTHLKLSAKLSSPPYLISHHCSRSYPATDFAAFALPSMASTSFRDSMNNLGWSRRDADFPVTTSSSSPILSRLQALNPFGDGGYVRLPNHEGPGAPLPAPSRREEEEGWFACEWLLVPIPITHVRGPKPPRALSRNLRCVMGIKVPAWPLFHHTPRIMHPSASPPFPLSQALQRGKRDICTTTDGWCTMHPDWLTRTGRQ